MGYIAYNIKTTIYLATHRGVKTDKNAFSSIGAARAATTREAKRGTIIASDFDVAESNAFRGIEKHVIVKNLMSGKDVTQSVNTPHSCDVSSEQYWSM